MTKIGIVGSRRRNDPADMESVMTAFEKVFRDGDWIVSGGCKKGADAFAEILAEERGVSILIHYPKKSNLDPVLMKKNPRAAHAKINYARNELIARDSDILIACVASDRTGGTEDTIKRFKKLHPANRLILV